MMRIVGVAVTFLSQRLLRPIPLLHQRVAAVARGDLSSAVDIKRDDELGQVLSRAVVIATGITAEGRLLVDGLTDELGGLWARVPRLGALALLFLPPFLGLLFTPGAGLGEVAGSIAVIAIYTFMGVWNNFMGPLIYLNDESLYPLALGLFKLSLGQEGQSIGLMMAGSFIMTLPIIVLFFFMQRHFIQGVSLTGVKG